VSKGEVLRLMAISSIERRSSILRISPHSCGVNDTEVVELAEVKTGTRRVEGIFFDSTCHSSIRRAASIRRLVLDFLMVVAGAVLPAEKANSPCGQIANS